MASLQPLRSYVRQNVGTLRASPCFLISSTPPPNDDDRSGVHDAKAHDFVQRNLSLSMQYDLRSTFCTISSAYPTSDSVDEAISLAKRAGMAGDGAIVIGVGSAAAIDLAKATATRLGSSSLVLSPFSLGGLWAASSPQHLLLDTKEECILQKKTAVKDTVITLDEPRCLVDLPLYSEFQPSARDAYCSDTLAMSHFAAGGLAVLLANLNSLVDESHQHSELISLSSELATVLRLACKLRQKGDDEMRETCTAAAKDSLLEAIPRLYNVLGNVSTSGPQTLANALLPTHFPQSHYVSFLGCTLNGICDTLSQDSEQDLVQSVASAILDTGENPSKDVISLSAWSEQMTRDCGIPSLSSYAFGTPDVKTLFGSLGSYESLMDQALSQTDRQRIEQVLRRSL